MKPNTDLLFARARRVTSIAVGEGVFVQVIDELVDAETGVPTGIDAAKLAGRSLRGMAAFLHDTYAGDTAFVVHAPSGFAVVRPPFSEVTVFYRESAGQVILWSGLEVPPAVEEEPAKFDLDCLSGLLLNWSWVTPATGLRGVHELLSGAILVCEGGRLQQEDLLAEAVRHLPTAQMTYEAQVNQIRKLILASVRHKVGSNLDEISILCSGGVDSSVLAEAAATLYPGRKLPLIHCFAEDHLNGDERFYFNAIANRLGWPTSTVNMNAGLSRSDLSPHLLIRSARPTKVAAALSTVAGMYELARANGSRVVLTGDGGDQLFLLADPLLYSRDVVREAATAGAKLRAAVELSVMARTTLWRVAGEVVGRRQARRLANHFFGDGRFAANGIALRSVPTTTEVVPGGASLAGISVSRAFQFFGMRNAELNRVMLKGYEIEERKAFVFWPLIRAALAAKRSHHLWGGRDRALERDAFREELPPEIYHRVRKGAARDFVERYDYEHFVKSLRESPAVRYGLIKERIVNIDGRGIQPDTAFALIVARGISDWMELHE